MSTPLTRSAIVGAARSLIATEGLDAVSLRRLAAVLGVTAPALYAHVQDKRDLLRAVAELEFAELIADFGAIDVADHVARLRRLSRIYIERALAEPELFRTMFLFPPDIDLSAATGQELPMATASFRVALDSVTAAIDAGELRPADPLVAALTLWTATHGVADVLLLGFPFDDATRDLVIDSVIDTVLQGLGAVSTVEAG
jgi:AcrR family transcriptional regulator